MKTRIYLAIMLAAMVSCEKTPDLPQDRKDIVITKTTADIIKSDNAFGLDLFQKVASHDAGAENIFVSPTSVALALAMTYNGADGDTKTDMETALKKQGLTPEEINSSYKSLIDALKSVDPRVTLEIANSIWYREVFSVLQEFVTTNQTYYDALVRPLDFDDPDAPGSINGWVNDKTHGKIKTIVDNISPETVMYLINAIYFKGMWRFEFDKENTAEGSFYLSDGSQVPVPMMNQTTTVPYATNDLFSMVELPYGRGNFSMLVFLPHNGDGADEIVNELTPENWDGWLENLHETEVVLRMPKFTFEYKNLLNDELDAMGMGVAFTDQADFSKINGTGGLYISKVLHKSFVEVNEEGTEAAAVTSVQIDITSAPGEIIFNVNHPFLFAIRETSTGTVLFLGRVKNPLTKTNG